MTDAIDRRSRRSRNALHGALMRLIHERDYETLTVQDILDEADVGRSTFYAHFSNKQDLLRCGFADLRMQLRKADETDRSSDHAPISLALFSHVAGALPAYRALVGGRGAAIAEAEFRKVVAELLGSLTMRTAPADDLPPGLRARFAVDAFLCVLAWGMEQKDFPDSELLDAHFQRLLESGLGSKVGRPPV